MKTKFKLLKSNTDFKRLFDLNELQINNEVIIKSGAVSGWAQIGKVIRITKTQVEVITTNLIPTIDTCRIGVKNPFKNRGEGFFEDWAFSKKCVIGKKSKFFIDTNIEVGESKNWNARSLSTINK